MKFGIVIYSTDPETVWNAFRLGLSSINNNDTVKVFLRAKGVECEALNTDDFNVTGEMQTFLEAGAGLPEILSTCERNMAL